MYKENKYDVNKPIPTKRRVAYKRRKLENTVETILVHGITLPHSEVKTVETAQIHDRKNKMVDEKTFVRASTPSLNNQESSSDSEGVLEIVEGTEETERIRIDKEIEEDIERELQAKTDNNTNLTVKNVKSILRYVIRNESVLAMIQDSMKNDLPKLTRSKARKLREEKLIPWPLSPIPVKNMDTEHDEPHLGLLISGELPEEEDDEEYRPNVEELNEPSDDETGRSSINNSGTGQFLELEKKEEGRKVCDKELQLEEILKNPENIGQRTRSKLSLSNIPVETIEQAFVPPDITTDMYDFQCDNEEWENFLKEFMQPLPQDMADDAADDDDPEYNVMTDEELNEETDREELRQDRGVKVPPAELRTLFQEFCVNEEEEGDSDDEEGAEKNRVKDDDAVLKNKVEVLVVEQDYSDSVSLESEQLAMTTNQMLLMLQQLRQHVQLLTQHFIQTLKHPLYNSYAPLAKTLLAQLKELAKTNDKVDVYNLEAAFEFVEDWEKTLMFTEEGANHEMHVIQEYQNVSGKTRPYKPDFSRLFYQKVGNSEVFLYPGLLPTQPFRCDNIKRLEFTIHEDMLIALGIEQFTPYIKNNPQWEKQKCTRLTVAHMISKYMIPVKTREQIACRIRMQRSNKNNPIGFYYFHQKTPKVSHYIIPFDEKLIIPVKKQPDILLPQCWKVGLWKYCKKIRQ